MSFPGNLSLDCNLELRQLIRENLKEFEVDNSGKTISRRAAVCLVIVDTGTHATTYGMRKSKAGEAALILTRRSERLKKHAGQWALPGGTIDKGETVTQAALRELAEEVGLHLSSKEVLGYLDDFTTRSGFTITPVVIWGGNDPILSPNHDEVESIHRIPLREFLREDAPILHSIPESDNPVLMMPVGQGWIATPTGAIIYQFREVALQGKSVRVAHYEQPYFAWR